MILQEFKTQYFINFFQDIDQIPCNPNYDNGESFYGYIAKQGIDLNNLLENIQIPNQAKVVDIGAGFCENLLFLGHVLNTNNLHAVELNETYTNQMSQYLPELPITFYNEDYREHDISSYDVIYSFCITKKQPEYDEFNDYILNNMKSGSLWIEVLDKNTTGNETVLEAITRNNKSFEIIKHENNVIIVKAL